MNRDLHHIRFGVNYVPSKKWWYCWNDFEPDEIARDLDAISILGADHIRIMLLWPYFQPNRCWVSEAHLDRLEMLMTLARERKLDVCTTMLNGWLSGWSFRPTFDRPTDFYTATEIREPVELYFRTCAERLNRHANFLGFDLGNEMNCCWKTEKLEDGDAWTNRMLDLCESISPERIHVNGVDHNPWFHPATFSPTHLARRQKLVALHSWIEFTGALKRGKALDPVCVKLAPAMAALARTYAGDPAKPVWLQEFGASSKWMDEKQIPIFLEAAAHAAVAGGICWMTWWCSHDVQEKYQFDPLEYDLGLIATDNKIKPAGLAFQRLARAYRGKAISVPALPARHLPLLEFEATWRWLHENQRELPDGG
jgi:endo-1,4-beta-mannosidase